MEPELIGYVDSIIGAPYQVNGRGPEHYDCLGVVLRFYREFRQSEVFDDTETVPEFWYEDPKYAEYMERLIKTHCEFISEPELYCLVLLAPQEHFLANHLGIYLGDGQVLNTSAATGICLSKLSTFKRLNQVKGYLRLKT